MKKALVYLSAIIFVSCSAIFMTSCNMAPYVKSVGYIDYTMYDNVFFVTESNSVSFEYKSLGSISVLVLSGYQGSQYIRASAQDGVTALVEEAMKRTGNGILALKISPYTDYTTKQSGYFVTGMAIKK